MLMSDPHRLCRLCLASDAELIDIFCSSSSDLLPSLDEKINLCLSVKVYPTDLFPTKLCQSCLDSVNKFYTFRLQSESSQKRLINFFSSEPGANSAEDDSLTLGSVETHPQGRTCPDNTPVVSSQSQPQDVSVCCPKTVTSIKLEMDETPDVLVLPNEIKRDTVKCQFCQDALESDSLLRKHVKDRHSPFACHCGAKFTSKRYLSKHESRHKNDRKVSCKLCGKSFLNTTELKEHMKSHNVGEKLTCDFCDYVTLYASNLSRHKKRHTKNYVLFCETCKSGVYDKDELQTHRIKVHGAEPFFCATCQKSFFSKSNLTSHMKTTHWTANKDFLCETCGKAFKTRSATKRHMKIHMGLSFSCHVCQVTVSSSEALKKHLKIHSGVKDVVCYVCGKAFVDIKYMAAHLRSHTGERPYECKECGKKFTQPTSLRVHMRYHTGERPFVCYVCGVGYVTKSLLKAHENHHSKVESKEVEIAERFHLQEQFSSTVQLSPELELIQQQELFNQRWNSYVSLEKGDI